jgi:hypothetical protein
VIYLVLLGLEHIWPALMTQQWKGWTIGVVATVLGGICDWVGIKGRVFFVPIWLLGLGLICFQLGVPGTIAFIALLIAGGVWIFMAAKKKEPVDWQKAQEAIIKSAAPSADTDESAFWAWVKATLFLPVWMNFTPELCQHNLKVLQSIRQSGIPLTPDENAKIRALEEFLARAQAASKPPGSEVKIQTAVEKVVDDRIFKAKRKPRGEKGVPPRIPVAR